MVSMGNSVSHYENLLYEFSLGIYAFVRAGNACI
jgi:hypothetical protein